MSKWHEYGENEYMFPEVWNTYECGDFYDAEYIKDWFKRCLADYPNIMAILEAEQGVDMNRSFQALLLVNEWKVKWFSQFIEDSEEGDEDDI